MSVEKNLNQITKIQKLTLENRKDLLLSGVEEIESFTDNEIVLITNLGKLTIKGQNLHINSLNTDTGDFSSTGNVVSLVYSKNSKTKTKFIERIFK